MSPALKSVRDMFVVHRTFEQRPITIFTKKMCIFEHTVKTAALIRGLPFCRTHYDVMRVQNSKSHFAAAQPFLLGIKQSQEHNEAAALISRGGNSGCQFASALAHKKTAKPLARC